MTVSGVQRDSRGQVAGVYGHDQTGASVEIGARFVIGADGLPSRVARSVGAKLTEFRHANGATQYAYYAGIPWPGIEFYPAERALAGIFPTHYGQACIWICTRPRTRGGAPLEPIAHRGIRCAAHPIRARARRALRDACRASPVLGVLRQPNQLRQAYGPGWALVSDAGYHRDAVTGYGISDAFRDAELLAVALDRALTGSPGGAGIGDGVFALAQYQRERDQALQGIFEITCQLAAYPAVPAFIELQKQLSVEIDLAAAALADRPIPGERLLAPTVPGERVLATT